MTLNDFVRQLSRDHEYAISEELKKIEKLNKVRESEEDKSRKLKEEIGLNHRYVSERSLSLKSIMATIDELKRQLRDLHKRLDEKSDELALAQTEVAGIQDKSGNIQKDLIRAEDSIAKISSSIIECELAKTRFQEKLNEAKITALQEYVKDIWKHILEMLYSQEDRKKILESRAKLEKAINDNPKIANLFEARTAWKNIITGQNHPLIKEKAKSELANIEDELSALFPGSLEIENQTTENGIIEELFYGLKNGDAYIYLPIPSREWNVFTEGRPARVSNLVANIIWALIKHFSIDVENGEFVYGNGFCYLKMNVTEKNIGVESINVTLSPDCSASLFLSRMPDELWEAING